MQTYQIHWHWRSSATTKYFSRREKLWHGWNKSLKIILIPSIYSKILYVIKLQHFCSLSFNTKNTWVCTGLIKVPWYINIYIYKIFQGYIDNAINSYHMYINYPLLDKISKEGPGHSHPPSSRLLWSHCPWKL